MGMADVRAIVRDLQTRYQHAKTLKAAFFESYNEGKGRPVAESGTAYFSRPGRMRWEYESPQTKLFLVDGTNAWFYVPSDHTASRAKVNESSDWRTPIALLAGKADLGKLCSKIELIDSDSAGPGEKALGAGNSVLRCTPRTDGQEGGLAGVILEVDAHAYLSRVLIRQSGGVETEFRFGNWQENVPVPEVQFHFQPPPGVSVVDEGTLADQFH